MPARRRNLSNSAFMENFDLFGTPVGNLNFKGKSIYRTWQGGFLSVFSLAIFCYFAIVKFTDLSV
jgi:hypothetical protein